MKYILLIQLLFASLFAHGGAQNHLHFFSSWHLDIFVLFLAFVICGFGLFKYLTKETN